MRNTLGRESILVVALVMSVIGRSATSPTATFLRVADDVESPSPSAEFPNISVTTCGMKCFKAGFMNCLGFQWRPSVSSDYDPSTTNDVDTTDSSSENCTKASLVGSTSFGRCGLLQCVPNPSSLSEASGSQIYFFRGEANLTYGSLNAPPSYSMACTYAYRVFDKIRLPYADASRQCELDGARLMTFKNVEEQRLILPEVLPDDGYWFGLTDLASEGNWVFPDGSVPTYTNWDDGQPNNFDKSGEDQDCAMLYKRNWNDNQCSAKLKFICQIVFIEL